MFVCNINLNKSKILKILLSILIIIIIISLLFGIYALIKSKKTYVNDEIKNADITEISADNYTNILKSSHENIDSYVGKKIKFSGFVYRLYDFTETQFVLGREMIVSPTTNSQAQAVVVGFLCDLENASSYEDGTWVEIEGTITRGYYHSELPVVKISNIQKVNCPENPYVYPPDKSYVETEAIS